MDYTRPSQDRSAQIDKHPTPVAREQPRLQQQINQLEKALSACHECAAGLERVADRILGPVPQGVSENAGKPPTDTLERRVADAIGYAEALHTRLCHAADRLNSAV